MGAQIQGTETGRCWVRGAGMRGRRRKWTRAKEFSEDYIRWRRGGKVCSGQWQLEKGRLEGERSRPEQDVGITEHRDGRWNCVGGTSVGQVKAVILRGLF